MIWGFPDYIIWQHCPTLGKPFCQQMGIQYRVGKRNAGILLVKVFRPEHGAQPVWIKWTGLILGLFRSPWDQTVGPSVSFTIEKGPSWSCTCDRLFGQISLQWRIEGAPQVPQSPMGPNSFIFACLHQKAPASDIGAPRVWIIQSIEFCRNRIEAN